MEHPNQELPALGIRQPWAELILRGEKSIEVRAVPTNVRGTIYVYSSQRPAVDAAAVAAASELQQPAEEMQLGVIAGTVEIVECRMCTPDDASAAKVPPEVLSGKWAWVLANPTRIDPPLKPRFLPYGIWFYPYRRKHGSVGGRERRGGYGRSTTGR